MTTIYFVRHAEPDHSCTDDRTRPLTPEGEADALSLVDFFRDKPVDAFVSSPYLRSYRTVLPAAESLGLGVATDERLRERKSGAVSNRHEMFRKRWADKNWAEEEGECLASVQERNVAALREILARHAGKTIAVGTHGTALSCIMNHFDPSFGCDDFLRIINFMPYVVRMTFEGTELVGKNEELIIEKKYPVG